MKKQDQAIKALIRSEERCSDGVRYSYELSMCESRRTASFRIPLYSISVRMTDSRGNVTSASTNDLFADAGKAILFFNKLVSALATPIDLAYIVEDEIGV